MFCFVLGVGLLLAAVPHYDWSGHAGWGGAGVTFIVLFGVGLVWVGVRDLVASAFVKVAAKVSAMEVEE